MGKQEKRILKEFENPVICDLEELKKAGVELTLPNHIRLGTKTIAYIPFPQDDYSAESPYIF